MTSKIVGLFLLGIAWAGACASPGNGSDSNTNWLTACNVDGDCGGLTCECRVCTQACTANADCDRFGSGSRCLTIAAGDPSCGAQRAPGGLCTRTCSSSRDCGSSARCTDGQCKPDAFDRDSGLPHPAGGDADAGDASPTKEVDGAISNSDGSSGCFFNIPPGGCRSYPTNAYGGSFLPSDCIFDPWSVGCLDYFSCIIACTRDADCPGGGSGDATPRCDLDGTTDGGAPVGACRLECGAGTVCPLGMACVVNPHNGRTGCYWATDFDCPACPVFPSCMN